jgi:hypothetical protein
VIALGLLALVVAASFAIWVAAPQPATGVHGGPVLPRNVEMYPGLLAALPEGGFLEFVGVVEDSRCPADAACVWQGRVVAEFAFRGERVLAAYAGGETAMEPVQGYRIAIEGVQPYPFASQAGIAPDAYRVTVTVTEAR